MHYAYSKKYKYAIGWSAKSGCTYFRQLFLELHKNELVDEPSDLWHKIQFDFPIPKNNISNISNINKIVICRNPYKRVVSMFVNRYCGGPGHCRDILHQNFQLKKITFRSFVKMLLHLKNNNKLNEIDQHISEQITNFNKNNAIIVKLEEFNENIVNAYKSLKLEQLIPKVQNYLKKDIFKNATCRNDENQYVYDKEYKPGKIISVPEYKFFYDQELLELVYKIYENDFKTFNYKKYKL